MKNRILSMLMALVLVFALAVNASATSEMPQLHEKGSLTIVMHYNGTPLNSGKLNALRVGAVEELSGGSYDFRIFAPLGRERVTQHELYSPQVAEELLAAGKKLYARDILSAPIENGNASFADLDTGLYLVWQEAGDVSEGLSAIQPFLISVPRWENDHYTLDVVASPKVPLLPEPTEPSTTPTEPPDKPPPQLPQTGQLNWPIPIMATVGLLLLIIGLLLCAGRKRRDYEKK